MNVLEQIKEEMKNQKITAQVLYELMTIRALKVAAFLLIGVFLLLFK